MSPGPHCEKRATMRIFASGLGVAGDGLVVELQAEVDALVQGLLRHTRRVHVRHRLRLQVPARKSTAACSCCGNSPIPSAVNFVICKAHCFGRPAAIRLHVHSSWSAQWRTCQIRLACLSKRIMKTHRLQKIFA